MIWDPAIKNKIATTERGQKFQPFSRKCFVKWRSQRADLEAVLSRDYTWVTEWVTRIHFSIPPLWYSYDSHLSVSVSSSLESNYRSLTTEVNNRETHLKSLGGLGKPRRSQSGHWRGLSNTAHLWALWRWLGNFLCCSYTRKFILNMLSVWGGTKRWSKCFNISNDTVIKCGFRQSGTVPSKPRPEWKGDAGWGEPAFLREETYNPEQQPWTGTHPIPENKIGYGGPLNFAL